MGISSRVSALAFVCVMLASTPPADAAWRMESGRLTLISTLDVAEFTRIGFQEDYVQRPFVFVFGTQDGGNPADLRIRDLSPDRFFISQVEPSGSDGPHVSMLVHYFAIESSRDGAPVRHQLPDGTLIEVGSIDTQAQVGSYSGAPNTFETVNFITPYTTPPVVLAQIQTLNNIQTSPPTDPVVPWLTTAVRNITTTGFEVALEVGVHACLLLPPALSGVAQV